MIVFNKGSFTLTGKNVTVVAEPKEPQAVFGAAEQSKQIGWWKGTLKRLDNDQLIEQNAHILQNDGMFKQVVKKYNNVTMIPFRAYFSALEPLSVLNFFTKYKHTENGIEDGDETDFPADEYESDGEMDDETGISPIMQTIDSDGTCHYYDLQGRQLNGKPNKGFYIRNGKKVIIK